MMSCDKYIVETLSVACRYILEYYAAVGGFYRENFKTECIVKVRTFRNKINRHRKQEINKKFWDFVLLNTPHLRGGVG